MKDRAAINLHLVLNNFQNDSRVLRETQSIFDTGMFDEINIAAFWEKGLEEHEHIGNKRVVWRVPLRSRKLRKNIITQLMQYLEWMIKIIVRFKKENITVIHCHDLPALPVGVFFKKFKKAKLIYDAHELETETIYLEGIKKKMAKFLEKRLIPFIDGLIVVSDSIAAWYKDQYAVRNVYRIRNIPYKQPHYNSGNSNMLKEKFDIEEDAILFICQGVLKANRGIEILLDSFSRMDRNKHIVFMGFGACEDLINQYQRECPNIHFQPVVSPEEIIQHSRHADAGISLVENRCLSYYYSLPNKVFEYILSELPIIVSDFPDMGKIVDEYHCGWKVNPVQDDIYHLINSITKDDILSKKKNVQIYKDMIVGWEKEKTKLQQLYQSLPE
jgi:glycosyltransferase involved in cell wall biosynthesis